MKLPTILQLIKTSSYYPEQLHIWQNILFGLFWIIQSLILQASVAFIILMEEKRSLTPAQIQYLRIGPKVCNSTSATRQLQDTLNQYNDTQSGAALSNISKFTYGHFQNTVNNFGVLLHRNFVGSSTLLQAQKFGNIAQKIDKHMQEQKDKPTENRNLGQKKSVSDNRIALKGYKLLLTLKSFSIEAVQTHRILQTLQLPFLQLLVSHVPSSRLVKAIENAMRQEGATITIDYQKMQAKIGHSANSEPQYPEIPYLFERGGQQLSINLPYLELLHSETDYRQNVYLENADILQILDSDFDNVEQIVHKYFNIQELSQQFGKTGGNKNSLPPL